MAWLLPTDTGVRGPISERGSFLVVVTIVIWSILVSILTATAGGFLQFDQRGYRFGNTTPKEQSP